MGVSVARRKVSRHFPLAVECARCWCPVFLFQIPCLRVARSRVSGHFLKKLLIRLRIAGVYLHFQTWHSVIDSPLVLFVFVVVFRLPQGGFDIRTPWSCPQWCFKLLHCLPLVF